MHSESTVAARHGAAAKAEKRFTSALLALVLVLPCLVGFAFPYLMLALVVLLTGALLWQRTPDWSLDPMAATFIVAFAAVLALCSITADNWRDVLSAFNFAALLLYLPMSVAFSRRRGADNATIVAGLCLAGALASLLGGTLEIVFGGSVGGELSDYIRFANTGLILGFLAPALGWRTATPGRRWIYLIGPAAAVVLVLISGARIAMLATPVLVFVLMFLVIRRKWIALLSALAAVAVIVPVGILLGGPRAVSIIDNVGSILSGAGAPDEAIRIRLQLYAAGLQAFAASPLFGHGPANIMTAAGLFLPVGEKALEQYPHLHNEALNFAVLGGVAGIALYGALLVAPVVIVLRSPKDSQKPARLGGIVLLVAAYMIMGATDTMLSFETHTALYVALTAVLMSYCRDEART